MKVEIPERLPKYSFLRDLGDSLLWGLYGAAAFIALTVLFAYLFDKLLNP